MSAVEAIRNPQARALQGTRAGIASRVAANGVDWLVGTCVYLGLLVGFAVARYLLSGHQLEVPDPPVWVTIAADWLILVVYLTAGWSTGRTIGKSLMGLRVVTTRAARLRPRRALLRAAFTVTVPVVLLWALVSRRNAGVHDIVLRTVVVYDWTPGP